MKKIQKTYLRIVNKLIAIIAAFTGLQACGISITPGYAPPAPLPIAEFSISGRVQNKLNGPIPFIQIDIETENDLTNENKDDKELPLRFHCNELGEFDIRYQFHENSFKFYDGDQFCPPQKIALIFEDIDGNKYGAFKTDTVMVPLEFKQDSTSFPNGVAKVTNLVITLEEQEQQEDKEEPTN